MALNKIKCENKIRAPLLRNIFLFNGSDALHTKMDENVILTKFVKMELCDPAFRPHVKQNKKQQNHCDS